MTQYQYKIFADYFQFYLQDEKADSNLILDWTQESINNLLALAPDILGIGTVRNMFVPVSIEILDAEPDDKDFLIWDHVNECSIDVQSGKIVVSGCTDYFPDAARISVTPGVYRVRIYYGKLDSLSEDGLDGEDYYKVILWLGERGDPVVLKRRYIN
jgi:hypothetical protein